ncbi:hypothetical protein [Paenibacillus larvae]|uniref:Uncharacterized protein n=1 Tax=Paenibacillus larvae subsp. larvae TaxID=147375 RepID=A0A6C0QSG4_9BACL|nr:hypothetical protein [Paenibacillus larvae]QHZ51176.1 hypothetical protein ERICV_02028 [Paenibacillus larvae subsp. larvae]
MENVKYRKVKRAAKVGEKIRAVDAKPYWGRYYENGDEFEVIKTCANGVLCRRIGDEDEEGRLYTLWSSEYVVLEPIEEPDEISDIKNEMERLTGELATLALRVSKLEEPKSPQEIRDEIVEKAKADRGTLATRFYGGKLEYTITAPNPPLATYAEFIINRKKRTVVCILRSFGRNRVCFRGIAKCAPGDVFNSHIGRAIALRRALRLEVPAEYLSVPNPTEIRERDIVGYTHPLIPLVYAAEVVDHNSWFISGSRMYLSVDYARGRRIIDDSREEGALDAYLA